jgi:GNAT superfamily N-acetyltransferase
MTLTIRLAGAGDRPHLAAHHHALNLHEAAIYPNRRTDPAGGEASLAETEERIALTGGLTLVAEDAGGVVGHLALTFERGPAYVREEERSYAYVAVLYVDAAARGRGIGTALLSEAERIALERGHRQMMVGVQSGNVEAERAYARFGFRPYSADLLKPLRAPPGAGA